MSAEPVLVLGRDGSDLRGFAEALGGRLDALSDSSDDAALENWRQRVASGAPCERIVVAVWSDLPERGDLLDLDTPAWSQRAEQPFLIWCAALGAAAARCADGGAIVAISDAPGPLDAAGWSPETGLAEAVTALVRSLAQSEGPRGVRVNAVTTPARLPAAAIDAPLQTFPGSLQSEVLGAVSLLLSRSAVGVTGHVLAADCGRSW